MAIEALADAGPGNEKGDTLHQSAHRRLQSVELNPHIHPATSRFDAEILQRPCEAAHAAAPGWMLTEKPISTRPAAEYPQGKLTELDAAVEALVAAHTCGAVIDAAWAAAHRLFRPARIA